MVARGIEPATAPRAVCSGAEAGSPPGKVVVPTLVLVAKRFILDEEVFLNYRLSTHVKRPDWYHPVNAEEEKRRWAVGG